MDANLLDILILEDRISDAELLIHELQKSGMKFNWERVETEEDFLRCIHLSPDIILSDYSMPQFDALRALEVLGESGLDIPFIIVSGTIGEDAAVAAMKAGAQDFFPKNQLTRLVPAVERELREANERQKRRSAEYELGRAEERFAKAFHASPVSISITTVAEGRFVDVNESFLKLMGFRRDEIIGRTATELNTWVDLADRDRMVAMRREPGTVSDYEVRFRTKSGEIRDTLLSMESMDLDDTPCILGMVHDITEHKRAENAIRESEERFRLLAENSTDMISRHTPDGVFLYVSPACFALLGYESSELVGHSVFEFFHADDLVEALASLTSVVERPDSATQEYRFRRQDGNYIWLETTSKTIRDPQTNAVLEMQSASRDISDRKRNEDSLQRYNERLRTLHAIDQAILTARSGDVVIEIALQYFLRQMSLPEASLATFNFEEREGVVFVAQGEGQLLPGQPLPLEEWSPDDITTLQSGVIQVIDDATALPHLPPELRALQDDRYAYLRVPLVVQNELIGTLNLAAHDPSAFTEEHREIAREVTDQVAIAIQQVRLDEQIRRYAAELEQRVIERTAELEWAKRRVEIILYNSSDAIIVVNVDGIVEQMNPGFQQLFGYSVEDALGSSLIALVEPEYEEAIRSALEALVLGSPHLRLEAICRHSSGSTVVADIVLTMLPEHYGERRSIICSLRDITERKRMEEGLRQALETERELNELKSRFVSIVSHEFRTPLTSILASSQLLKLYRERMTNQRQVEHLDKIERQVRLLTDLLNDVLTLSRAEAVGLSFNPAPLDLELFCRNFVEEIQVITKTPHQIIISTDGLCGGFAGDEKLLRQIVANLLTNAIKYSPEGGNVVLDASCSDSEAIIRVQDEGLGIPEDDLRHLYEPFHRAKNVGDISGTGLGLPIVKRAVEAHGGSISVDSKVGVGTTFTIRLPLNPP